MSEDTIFREVTEELRGDRARAFWRTFGPYVIGAAVLVVLAVAANEGWRWWENSNAARSADQFYVALEAAENGDIPAANAALDTVVAEGAGGYPTLAKFRKAALLARDGKAAEAVAAYDALATSESNLRLRELALVLAANLLVDGGDVAAVEQRVGGMVSPDNAMRNAAREAIGLARYKAGDLNAALATFSDIGADPLANRELQQRVQIYTLQLVAMGALTPEQIAAAAAAPVPAVSAVPDPAPALDAAPAMSAEPAPAMSAEPVPAEPAMAPSMAAEPAPTMAAEPASAPATAAEPAPAMAADPATPAPAGDATQPAGN